MVMINFIHNQNDVDKVIEAYRNLEYRDEIFYGMDLEEAAVNHINGKANDAMMVSYSTDDELTFVGFMYQTELGRLIHISYTKYEMDAEIVETLVTLYPDSIFERNSGFRKEYGLELMNDVSSIDSDETYGYGPFWTKSLNKDILRDKFEELYVTLPTDDIDVEHLKFDSKKSSDIWEDSMFNPKSYGNVFFGCYSHDINGTAHEPGFHYYYKGNRYCGDNSICLRAFNPVNNKMVGAISYSIEGNILYISFVDVAKGARNRGIATAMIKELDKIQKPKYFRIGMLSDMGKKVHIDGIFKKNIHNVTFVEDAY